MFEMKNLKENRHLMFGVVWECGIGLGKKKEDYQMPK